MIYIAFCVNTFVSLGICITPRPLRPLRFNLFCLLTKRAENSKSLVDPQVAAI